LSPLSLKFMFKSVLSCPKIFEKLKAKNIKNSFFIIAVFSH